MSYVKLTDCEELVMKCVWDAGKDLSLVETMALLKDNYGKNWKRQTISTFLLHLIQKGFLTSYRVGRVFYYHQEIDLESFRRQQTEDFLKFWYDGSVQTLFSNLQEQGMLKEEEKEIIQEEKARKHKNKKADKRKVRTGGFVDEIDEEDVTGYSENKKKVAIQQTAQTAASEAHAELKKEIAAATSEEADMLSRLEMAERTVEENRKPHPAGKVEEVPEEEEEPVTIGSLAMPSYSAAQLASRVKKAGDAPDIVKDDITKVTLFDYSDIISGDVDDMEE